MNIVLDTNVLLVSLSSRSAYHLIYLALQEKAYDLYLTNEILAEYEEQIGLRLGLNRTDLQLIELLNLSNVHKIIPYYYWQLIDADKDDNKFADCAVSCNADYLVTNDRHYDVLATIEFPEITVIKAADFLKILKDLIA
ncbi:putative toxin-antitoxin system toxin component, PIN family [Dyadobacter sp. CY356]|uniref:putative toxin-antitoxin system toxin component, PIN family n=1 Tax=Dyadobacter sp. CY356 TaxID=2906442 RepID=UPI001F306639|nr:putative toxin-antitoxin system toxin component, PIN family [Dyadobacter sp. CY356]MCF0058422.1 putative toxin-antitoxin system toxin component, PIN family [Dyadobacter sp. CY356]